MNSALVALTAYISFAWTVLAPGQKEAGLAREHILRIFPEATSIERHSLRLSSADEDSLRGLCQQRWTGDGIEVLVPNANDTALGYAVIDNVKGKDQLITYLVITTPAFSVKNVEILAYRESYGGEIRNSSWLRQFLDKQVNDDLRPGRDVKNITGATISARSVTLGVKKTLCLLHILKERLPRSAGIAH